MKTPLNKKCLLKEIEEKNPVVLQNTKERYQTGGYMLEGIYKRRFLHELNRANSKPPNNTLGGLILDARSS